MSIRQLGVSVLINAALGGGYRSTIGQAKQGLGEVEKGLLGLQRRIVDIGQAWAGISTLRFQIKAGAELEHQLMEIGITADMSNGEVAKLHQHLRQLSIPGETNQSVGNLAKAYKTLTAAGLENDKASTALRAIGRTATAATADIEDVSKMSFTLIDTLGIAPDALGKELDRLAYAGKKGSFELKDMARSFPVLGAAAKDAGLTGSEGVATLGAALQVARKGAGESAEAANNMKNFLQKMLSPQTIKNMEKAGVNVVKLMADAMKQGENPLEVYMTKLDKMLGTDATKRKVRLGALFEDAQVQDFIRPMLQRMDQYKKDKADILVAAGTVDQDYSRIMGTFKEKSDGTAHAIENLGEAIGKAWLKPLGQVAETATPVITFIGNLADKSPTATLAISGLGTALVVIPPMARTAALAMGFLGGTISIMGRAIAITPIGAAITGIALLAGLIYDHWEPIKTFFVGLWETVGSSIDGVVRAANKVKSAIGLGSSALKQDAQPSERIGAGMAAENAPLGGRAAEAVAPGGRGPAGEVNVNVRVDGLPRGSTVETKTIGGGIGDFDLTTGYIMGGT